MYGETSALQRLEIVEDDERRDEEADRNYLKISFIFPTKLLANGARSRKVPTRNTAAVKESEPTKKKKRTCAADTKR